MAVGAVQLCQVLLPVVPSIACITAPTTQAHVQTGSQPVLVARAPALVARAPALVARAPALHMMGRVCKMWPCMPDSLARSLCLWKPARPAGHNCTATLDMGGHFMSAVQEALAPCIVFVASGQGCASLTRV